jgi:hypothetical protein
MAPDRARSPELKIVDPSYDPVLDGWKEAYQLLEEDLAPLEWTIDRLIAPGTLNLLTGAAKAYKTWFMHHIAITAAIGGKLVGQFQCKRSRVMFVQAEELDRQHRRKFRWCVSGAELKAEEASKMHILARTGRLKLTEPQDRDAFRRAFDSWLPQLVLADSLRRTHKGDERDQSLAQTLKDGVDEFQRDFPECAWIVNHHTRKLSGDSDRDSPRELVSGHGDLIAVVDGHIAIQRDRKTNIITVTHDAGRDDEELKPFLLRFHGKDGKAWFEWLGYVDETGAGDPTLILVLSELRTLNEWIKTKELIERIKLPERKVRGALERLLDDGKIFKRPSGGSDRSHEWKIADEGE